MARHRAEVVVSVLQPNPNSGPGSEASRYISKIRQDLSFTVQADTPSAAKQTAIETFQAVHADRFFVKACYPQSPNQVLLIVMQTHFRDRPVGLRNRVTTASLTAKQI